jgi:hypothetical protein
LPISSSARLGCCADTEVVTDGHVLVEWEMVDELLSIAELELDEAVLALELLDCVVVPSELV